MGRVSKLGRMLRSGLRRYPRHVVGSLRKDQPTDELPALPAPSGASLSAVWLGHATTLVRTGGVSVLTDPVFSSRIGMRVGKKTVGLARREPLPVDPSSLDAPEIVLISHAHFDHLDRPTLERLANRNTTLVTARRTARLIPRGFARVIELDWGAELISHGLSIRALEPAHWGARAAIDRRRGYNAYLVESDEDRVFFAGDTAYTESFADLEHVRLAIFGIGAYEPWEHAHATPEQVWRMFASMGADYLMPVHHSTFELSDEPMEEPMDRLLNAAGDHAERVVCKSAGELWDARHTSSEP